ncbi:Methylenetetrahydrofolate dehydrogenase (NADP(+)) [Nitrosococcus halophilus Nc 4]|uniref:Methylenetetrahydrofolate dehydrogenase (NADP(+)) n=1 Tax=Nitrosococcus halophilus (strain Nc4) TaxID=472759 RepID=D5C3H7_NITHN|nr:NAD(P)-dependent methylenetetrahydromethanopterin dehydrogenase [Nitrosococcus halophilus]ADE16884.1 Methylenetetrahydrofolate dehydrogenase (NADP(+)) [Nitrosococcus halophilus Nc 4]
MKKLLLQLDTDPIPSVFDQVVAYDSGVDHIMSYGGVTPDKVEGLVHGLMFTRGGKQLANSAIFLGGSHVSDSQQLAEAVKKCFFGSVRVSVMLDPNGANTTAAALARKIVGNYDIRAKKAVILAGTGPVGQRCALYLLKEGASEVVLTSRHISRSMAIAEEMQSRYQAKITPAESHSTEDTRALLENAHVAITCGPPGVSLLPQSVWSAASTLEIMADVNAVPPLGVEEMEVTDDGVERFGKRFYGAIAIGNLKMKIHRSSIASLFKSNDCLLDEITIYDIACEIDK